MGQYDGSAGHPNVFQGKVSAGKVTFANVPIDSLGPNAQRVLRIVNLRADASGLGVGATPSAITAVLAFDGGGPSIANNTPAVGFVQAGSSFSRRAPLTDRPR